MATFGDVTSLSSILSAPWSESVSARSAASLPFHRELTLLLRKSVKTRILSWNVTAYRKVIYIKDIRRKLELVVQVAESVWGNTAWVATYSWSRWSFLFMCVSARLIHRSARADASSDWRSYVVLTSAYYRSVTCNCNTFTAGLTTQKNDNCWMRLASHTSDNTVIVSSHRLPVTLSNCQALYVRNNGRLTYNADEWDLKKQLKLFVGWEMWEFVTASRLSGLSSRLIKLSYRSSGAFALLSSMKTYKCYVI